MTAAQTKRQRRFLERYGPWAVVTGASSGIGRALAGGLAELEALHSCRCRAGRG